MLGTDFKNFEIENGDLLTVSDIDNLAQACINRLNTQPDFWDWCYDNYGGNIDSVFGMKNNSNSLEYLRIEVEHILQQDPRIKSISADCTKESGNEVYVELDILAVGNDEVISINLVITDDLIVKLNDDTKLAVGDRI